MAIWDDPNVLSGESRQVTEGAVKPKLGVVMLHQGRVTTTWAMRWSDMRFFMPPHIYILNRNQPYDTAREQSTRALLEKNVEYVFHFDSDCIFPANIVQLMIEYSEKFNLPILSGVYWAKKPLEITGGVPMPCAWLKTGYHPEQNRYDFQPIDITPWLGDKAGPIVPVDVTGAGCLLVKADVFKKLDESNPKLPFFQWGLGRNYYCPKCGASGPLPMLSEDFYFLIERCQKELGLRPHICTNIMGDHECDTIKRARDGMFELTRM